jgi:diketogulonate reductase-like aldo/keto reductase
MELRPFGAKGPSIPVFGQGTWRMEGDDRAGCVAALKRGFDLGLTHIDTAELYGRGVVEDLVGEAIAGRRDEVFLVSKVLPENASYEGTQQACERSLRRLKTDRLDCYLLHWAGRHPLADTLKAFAELEQAGKIRAFGVSNFDERELADAVRLAGPGKIACNQVLYHLGERAIEHAVLPACEAEGIAVVGYSPFGSGRFPVRAPVLTEIAARHGATARQVALAFLTRKPSLFAIPKASHAAHVEDNAGAARLQLTPADLVALEAAFPLGRRRGGVPTQ